MSRTPIPDKAYRRIADIDIEQDICARGLRLAILDIDGTLKNRVLRKAPPDTVEWVKRCLDAGVYVCLVSNDRRNRHVAFSDDLYLCQETGPDSDLVFLQSEQAFYRIIIVP